MNFKRRERDLNPQALSDTGFPDLRDTGLRDLGIKSIFLLCLTTDLFPQLL